MKYGSTVLGCGYGSGRAQGERGSADSQAPFAGGQRNARVVRGCSHGTRAIPIPQVVALDDGVLRKLDAQVGRVDVPRGGGGAAPREECLGTHEAMARHDAVEDVGVELEAATVFVRVRPEEEAALEASYL